MRLLDLTLDDPQSNLALDEALLLEATSVNVPSVLRLWEPQGHFVVLGRGSKVAEETHRDECDRRGVPILRRCSGGAAIVTGPGCLMYTVVLNADQIGDHQSVDSIHDFVLQKMSAALSTTAVCIVRLGISDMAIEESRRKFSGNSLRIRRLGNTGQPAPSLAALYHGTILYDYPLQFIPQLLGRPPRTPEYRQDRNHEQFVTNLPMATSEIRQRIIDVWQAKPSDDWPQPQVEQLVRERYSQDSWNLRH